MLKKTEKIEDEDEKEKTSMMEDVEKKRMEENEKRMDICIKERHSSGESLDSSYSMSPYDSIRLEDTAAKTEDSEEEETYKWSSRFTLT